jgi:hypothetical protein
MSAAVAPAPAAAAAGPDFSKYTVFFTGFKPGDKDYDYAIFSGNLSKDPGDALPTILATGEKSADRFSISPDQFKSEIAKLVRSGVCSLNVDPEYIVGSRGIYETNPIRALVLGPPVPSMRLTRKMEGDFETNGGLPLAFLIGREVVDGARTGVYIDVICSYKESGIGTRFLQYFHRLVALLGYDFIKLSSLANVVTYYPRPELGYRFRSDCGRDVGFGQEILTTHPYRLATKYRPVNPKTGKASWPNDTEEAVADEDYLNFIHFLHRIGLTTKTEDGCDDPALPKAEFVARGCATDGFKMAKCDLTAERGTRLAGGRRSRRHRRHRRTTRRNKK